MQHKLGNFFKPHLAEILEENRKEMHLTQKEFAEALAISVRYYYDLKNGISMTSTPEFILFLKMHDDEKKLEVIHALEKAMESEDYTTYVNRIDFI